MKKHKLKLDRETIATLANDELVKVAGGTGQGSCQVTMCQSCTYKSAVQRCPIPRTRVSD